MKKKVIIGLDFDGVVAYNPARLARLPISFIKQHVLGIKKVSFFVPKTRFQRMLWALGHETSVIPAYGATLLREVTKDQRVEAHLVSARFGFLEPHLLRFLDRWNLRDVFTTITVNTHEEQPHLFKERMVRTKKFDYFIEDNWDIVHHLNGSHIQTHVHWIYNLLDRGRTYPHKYPHLQKSLERIIALDKIKA